MNSRKLLFIVGLVLSSAIGSAQSLSLPYYVDWTDDQNDGWQVFVKGDGLVSYSWSFNQNATRGSYEGEWFATGPISHVDDWIVSPALNLSSGASISFSYRVGSDLSVPPSPGDSAQLYVLTGNADPALATKRLLANIDAASETISKDTSIYMLPASAASYLAFRYTATTDSDFWENISKLHVAAVPTSVKNVNGVGLSIRVYPNPATDRISWNITASTTTAGVAGTITDLSGRTIMNIDAASGYADISKLPQGIYMLEIGNQASSFVKQ